MCPPECTQHGSTLHQKRQEDVGGVCVSEVWCSFMGKGGQTSGSKPYILYVFAYT